MEKTFEHSKTDAKGPPRPVIASFSEPVDFVQAMIHFLKQTDSRFSVLAASKKLRRLSPALVSLVIKKKRALSLDRVEEFSQLLRLTMAEKIYFREWVSGAFTENNLNNHSVRASRRKELSSDWLRDWINPYVKDCFQIPQVQIDPSLALRHLANLAQPARIKKSIHFLLSEGHLRRTLDGKIVTETPLTVTDPARQVGGVPSAPLSVEKIRQFHKGALQVARTAIDTHPASERYANTIILPLTENHYQQLVGLVQEFAEKIKDFSAEVGSQAEGDRLYQVVVHLSPTGGKFE
jgi:uncharacterized protein (TIGR02147 family)